MNLLYLYLWTVLISVLVLFLYAFLRKRRMGALLKAVSIDSQHIPIGMTAIRLVAVLTMMAVIFHTVVRMDWIGVIIILMLGVYTGIQISEFCIYPLGIGLYENGVLTPKGPILNDEIDYAYCNKLNKQDMYVIGFVRIINNIRFRYTFYANQHERRALLKTGAMFFEKVEL